MSPQMRRAIALLNRKQTLTESPGTYRVYDSHSVPGYTFQSKRIENLHFKPKPETGPEITEDIGILLGRWDLP